MKRLYIFCISLTFLAACTSQRYSNLKYQERNNTDDAYFSPSDVKKKEKAESANASKYQGTPSFYDNTDDETANPNAPQGSGNYRQYTQNNNSGSTTQVYGNANALQYQPAPTLNYQPQWGAWFTGSPFSPYYGPYSSSFTMSIGNGAWYAGPNMYGAGWVYNPWYGYTYNPWAMSYWGNPYWGNGPYSSFGYHGYNSYMYNPWMNAWVYNPYPYGYSGWGYNPYNPYGYGCNNYYGYNNYWGGGNNNKQTTNNLRRRASNSFMPAVRNTGAGTGGTRIVGSPERQAQNPTGTNANTTPGNTYSRGNATPNNNNYRSYTPGNTSPGTTNGNANNNVNRNNNNNATPGNYQPTPSQPRNVPSNSNGGRDVFSPRNNSGSGGGGGNGGGGGPVRRR